jgi:hypothetical protein
VWSAHLGTLLRHGLREFAAQAEIGGTKLELSPLPHAVGGQFHERPCFDILTG